MDADKGDYHSQSNVQMTPVWYERCASMLSLILCSLEVAVAWQDGSIDADQSA